RDRRRPPESDLRSDRPPISKVPCGRARCQAGILRFPTRESLERRLATTVWSKSPTAQLVRRDGPDLRPPQGSRHVGTVVSRTAAQIANDPSYCHCAGSMMRIDVTRPAFTSKENGHGG